MQSGAGGAASATAAAGSAAPGAVESMSVVIPPEVAATFKDLKQRRKLAWMLMRIDTEHFRLEVVKTGTPGPQALAELLAALPLGNGAYFVFDLPVKNTYGGQGSSLRFFTWAPAAAPGKATVIYAAQRKTLDTVFTGCIDALATCKGDVETALGAQSSKDDEEWDPDA